MPVKLVQECAALTLLMRPHASLAGPCGGHSGHPEDIYSARCRRPNLRMTILRRISMAQSSSAARKSSDKRPNPTKVAVTLHVNGIQRKLANRR